MTMTTIENAETENYMKFYQVSRSEIAVQKALYDLWYKHYNDKGLQTADRRELVDDFIAEHLSVDTVLLTKSFIRHPQTRKKQFGRTATPLEVLADFMLNVDAIEERTQEYPIKSAESSFRHEMQRKKTEQSIYFQDEYDADHEIALSQMHQRGYITPTMPSNSVSESELIGYASEVEAEFFREEPQSVQSFRRILRNVKRNPKKYALRFEAKGRSYKETIERIRKLDDSRVKACYICREPFYAHDKRRIICDLQQGIVGEGTNAKRSKQSMCEVIHARKRAEKGREIA